MPHWTEGPQSILAPTGMDDFINAHWEGVPLVIQGRDPSIYEGLLSLDTLDELIHSSGLRSPTFRLVQDGDEIPPPAYTMGSIPWGTGSVSGFINRDATRHLMRQGATFVMEACQRILPSVAALSRTFEQAFHCPSPVNLYVTPGNAQGFKPHYDVQNVFVLQLHGTKKWKVFRPDVEHPSDGQSVHCAVQPSAELLHEVTLSPGDLLYLPRGYGHVAHTTDELSVHLSVSLLPTIWADVFRSMVDTLHHDPRFREAVPLQPNGPAELSESLEMRFNELMQTFVEGSDLEDTIDEMGVQFVATRLPATAGQLRSLIEPGTINIQSVVRRPQEIVWRVDSDGENAQLHFHGKSVSAPWNAISTLRWIAESDEFNVRDIPGDINDDIRCELSQHLVNEGFLFLV
jgi:ribosomal protein L16 Arg81 hydroxylase